MSFGVKNKLNKNCSRIVRNIWANFLYLPSGRNKTNFDITSKIKVLINFNLNYTIEFWPAGCAFVYWFCRAIYTCLGSSGQWNLMSYHNTAEPHKTLSDITVHWNCSPRKHFFLGNNFNAISAEAVGKFIF